METTTPSKYVGLGAAIANALDWFLVLHWSHVRNWGSGRRWSTYE